jgi:predicted peroxiredoxin
MAEENISQEHRPLTREELNQLAGEELPERAAMSLINANVAAPVNAAVALNALSDGSTAVAQATQTAPITQHN